MPTRRGHGEGAVFKRKDGRWVAAIDQGWSNGRRQRKLYYARSQKEAYEKLFAARRNVDDGLPLPPERLTLGQFLNDWLRDVASGKRDSTRIRYEQLLRLHVVPALGSRPIGRVNPKELSTLYAAKRRAGLSPASIERVHSALHRALADAVRWGLMPRNICDLVKPARAPKYEARTFNKDEALRFLDAVSRDPLRPLYVLALTTGMREGELLALKWQDLDLDARRLEVRRSIRRISGAGFVEFEPKSARGRRLVVLSSVAVEALRQHRVTQAEERLQAPVWDDQDRVFPNQVGRPIEPGNLLKRHFYPLLERAGLPHLRFHDLRHSAATLLLAMGVHLKIVQEMLGHSTITVTADLYSHVLPSMQQEPAEKMGQLLSGQR
jgi:integrase